VNIDNVLMNTMKSIEGSVQHSLGIPALNN